MATALACTYQAGTGTDPPRVLLQVTGAPTLTVPYLSAFSVGNVDGWTGSAGTSLAYATGYSTGGVTVPPGLLVTTAAETVGTFSRTVTGLTIGQFYTFSLMAIRTAGKIALGRVGGTGGSSMQPTGRNPVSFSFLASATSHVITVTVTPPATAGTDIGVYRLDTIKVARLSSWSGTTITRTDANGTAPVRLSPAQDAEGASGSATMTVTDYEAALTGPVSYTVTDGNGATATASSTTGASPGVWLTLPAGSDPAAPAPPPFVQPTMVSQFDSSAESNGTVHKIIGRADPIANPGPLTLGAGSLELWCPDYTAADSVRALLAAGDVAQLRQPTFPGMDVYLVATHVQTRPTALVAGTQSWTVVVQYTQVAAP